MRRVENFIKIVVLTVMMTAVLLVVDLLVLTCFGVWTDAGLSRVSMTGLAEQTSRMCDERGALQYSMSQQGMAKLDAFEGFAFIMDDAGDVVWSYRMPPELPVHYTIKDAVQFSRYYLMDYPVYTYIMEDGILVAGMPRQTVWKYVLSFQIRTIEMFASVIPVLFLINIVLLLAVPFLIIRRDAHRRERQRTSWIAGVSHDIRTPLSLVLGYADELLRAAKDSAGVLEKSAVARKAQMIEHQAIRMKTLVTNLNTSNKLAYGMGVWHRENVLLAELMRASICEILNRGLDEKYDICVIISDSLEQLSVRGDRELIKRLMENLVNNAINHNPQGCEIRVCLTTERFWRFDRIVLEVSDNGGGVSKKQLHILQTLAKTDKLPEHGLGLRLVRQIAAFHHWRVRFLNRAEGGLACRVYISGHRRDGTQQQGRSYL